MSAEISAEPKHSSDKKPSNIRRWVVLGIVALAVIVGLIVSIPWIYTALTTISTDDAYVNGHVTFSAPRVSGQVSLVRVDDNNRVHKGDLLVQLDPKPYQVVVAMKQAAVDTAQADLRTAQAQVRANEALARSLRWKLQHAMEEVRNQIAALNTAVAALDAARAVARNVNADLERRKPLVNTGAVSAEEFDNRTRLVAVAFAQVKQALEGVYQIRVSLGLSAAQEKKGDPSSAPSGKDPLPVPSDKDPLLVPPDKTLLSVPSDTELLSVPPDLDETFSSVRQAQAELMQAAFQIGVISPMDAKPRQMLEDFLKRDPQGNIDNIYALLLKDAPAVKQAEAKLAQAERDLDQANLNLTYCDVFAEIDGVVTRRNVNVGNNVVAGQELMAIRSLKEIWVDANFKETELADLKIGQPVDLHLDMYGRKKVFKGRISGFTMGTGSTLALLPAQNATGNFVKVVQRLPVRIDLEDYDADKDPLFVGLSVEPRVYYRKPTSGPNAGAKLQPYLMQPPPAAPTTRGGGQ